MPAFSRLVLAAAATSVFITSFTSAQNVTQLPPIPGDLSTPVQQRLAYYGLGGMSIGWNTFQKLDKPTVHYGLTPKTLFLSASSAESFTYPTSRTWSNTVILNNLLPHTTYYYRIDSTNSSVDSFTTARLKGDPSPFTTALVIDMGVFGPDGLSTRNTTYSGASVSYPLQPGEHTTIQRLVSDASSYEFVIHPGDFAYADTWLKEVLTHYINGTVAQGADLYEGLNEQFYDQLSDVTRFRPYMVSPGNHEANCDNGGTKGYTESLCPLGQRNFTQFINRFGLTMPGGSFKSTPGLYPQAFEKRALLAPTLPYPSPRNSFEAAANRARASAADLARAPFWYSFDYGMTHFVMFDTETDLGGGLIGPDQLGGMQGDLYDGPFGSYVDQQVDFLKKDLAAVDRFITPWVVAAGHRPWYVSNGQPCFVCQTAFEPIFYQYGVDIAVFGHTHNMQRNTPTAFNVTDPAGLQNPKAPMYIVNGAAGHYQGLEPVPVPTPNYTVWYNDTAYGFSKLSFQDRNHLQVQFIRSTDGAVLDQSTLYKKHDVRSVNQNFA